MRESIATIRTLWLAARTGVLLQIQGLVDVTIMATTTFHECGNKLAQRLQVNRRAPLLIGEDTIQQLPKTHTLRPLGIEQQWPINLNIMRTRLGIPPEGKSLLAIITIARIPGRDEIPEKLIEILFKFALTLGRCAPRARIHRRRIWLGAPP